MLKINSLNFEAIGQLIILTLIGLLACTADSSVAQSKAQASTPEAPTVPANPVEIDANYLLGKFDQTTHPDFVAIAAPYTDKPAMMMRREAFEAFEQMWKAAQKEGITLKIISSTRNFEQQKKIWEGKWARFEKDAPLPKDRALKILEYSSMPGSSRHHWGTDIDLNDLNNSAFEGNGKYEKLYRWLAEHAHEYGFCQPYTPGRPSGYHEEKWHWSYTPLSKVFLEKYKNSLDETSITGFKGAETAPEIGIVKNYVLGINEACK